jgi:hypothetical protein
MIRRYLMTLAVALSALLWFAVPVSVSSASASTTAAVSPSCAQFAAIVTSFQSSQVAEALANNPAGTCTGPGQISWESGSVVMVIPAQVDIPSSCPTGGNFDTGWACVYNVTHFRGTRPQFHDCCFLSRPAALWWPELAEPFLRQHPAIVAVHRTPLPLVALP